MKLLFAVIAIGVASINASDSASKLLRFGIQATTINLIHDAAKNTVMAHHHFNRLVGCAPSSLTVFYDTSVTESLGDCILTIESYKSAFKPGVLIPALSTAENDAIVELLKTRICQFKAESRCLLSTR